MKTKFKKILVWFIAYYLLGFVVINIFSVSRFLHSPEISKIAPKLIIGNIMNPNFWGLILIWPLYIGLYLYNFFIGNFGY